MTVDVSFGGFTVLALCSPLSRTQPARPRRPPNCLDDSTAPVFASTITFVCVFLPLGMMSIAYWVMPLSTFISPDPIWPGTAQSATIFAESGEIIPASGLKRSDLISTAFAAVASTVLHTVPVGRYHSMTSVSVAMMPAAWTGFLPVSGRTCAWRPAAPAMNIAATPVSILWFICTSQQRLRLSPPAGEQAWVDRARCVAIVVRGFAAYEKYFPGRDENVLNGGARITGHRSSCDAGYGWGAPRAR